MVNINKKELSRLQKVNQGNFGSIYRDDDKAYKVYFDDVKTIYGTITSNPMLKKRVIPRLNRLISLSHSVKNTDLIYDMLYIDGKYSGVVMPYYNGVDLNKLLNNPLESKISLAKELVENSKELSSRYIYPMDYKLINMMLVNGHVKLIDLDDVFTKVSVIPNPILNREAIIGLDETIKTFFKEGRYFAYLDGVNELTTKEKPKCNTTYDGISEYIKEKEKPYTYLVLDNKSDIDADVINDPNTRVIISFDSDYNLDEIKNYILELNRKGIQVYDIISTHVLNKYLNSTIHDEVILSKNKSLVRIK